MEHEGSDGSEGSAGLLQQILSLKLVPRVGNGTLCPNATSLCSFPATARRHQWTPGTCRVLPVQYLRGQRCGMVCSSGHWCLLSSFMSLLDYWPSSPSDITNMVQQLLEYTEQQEKI